ncbi:hypothetical protein CEXT_185311 [Caerostris extrusa]|uniref:Uncharacterized protein n=1 Tax=Caerostris extrusa TaxID=172846 RepID=A0AAV4NL16_CAEEX|nr:hypothetical protein CEXT_185311 [Caerostris extrusa]
MIRQHDRQLKNSEMSHLISMSHFDGSITDPLLSAHIPIRATCGAIRERRLHDPGVDDPRWNTLLAGLQQPKHVLRQGECQPFDCNGYSTDSANDVRCSSTLSGASALSPGPQSPSRNRAGVPGTK